MQRYNIFYQIHKGLREMLYQTASRLQQTDFTNATETEPLIAQMNSVLDLFDKHAATEDHFILPAIATNEPSVTTLFEEEHVQDHALSDKLRSVLKGLQVAATDQDKNTWGTVLRPVFVDFVVFNLTHMAKEEEVLNKLLWRYYSDEDLQGITQQILAYQPPATLQLYSSWMMRGLSNYEITVWLKEVKNSAPEFVFNGLLALAEQELPGERWHTVQENISEGALMA